MPSCAGSRCGCRSLRHSVRRLLSSVSSAPSGGSCAALKGSQRRTTPASRLSHRGSPRPCSPRRWGSPRPSRQSSPTTRSPSISAVSPPPSGEVGEDRYQPLAEINVTPMVDVMLVLLVIFMVTAPLLTVGVPLDLPKTQAAAITEPKPPVILSLNRVGEVFIGDERIDPGDLEGRLSRLAAEDPTRIVFVRGDQTISYAQLMDALGLVNRAGFSKVSLVAEATASK